MRYLPQDTFLNGVNRLQIQSTSRDALCVESINLHGERQIKFDGFWLDHSCERATCGCDEYSVGAITFSVTLSQFVFLTD